MARDHVTVGGAPEGFDARLVAAELDRRGAPVIHVARDDKRLAEMQAALAFLAPDVATLTFPAWECLPYDRISPNPDVSAARMATLAALAHGMPSRFVLLTTVNAITQRVPPRETLREAAFTARVGHRLDEQGLRRFLRPHGFRPGADRGRARRLRRPRRHHRRLAAGRARAGPARPLRRRARGGAALRPGDPAHDRDAVGRRVRPGLGGDSRRGGDHPLPPDLPGRVRRHRRRSALRGGLGRAQARRDGALAAVLPRAAGDAVRLPARRLGVPRRPGDRGAPRPVGVRRRRLRRARRGD